MKDNSWEQFGKDNPYFAVLTDSKFKTKNLNHNTLNEFFNTGEEYVREIILNLQKYFSTESISTVKNALDFGCGTGRILIPFAQRFPHVVGVDISDAMLKEAKKNLDERGLLNVNLIQSSDITKINFPQCFDFIHTSIVLQHIPQEQGYGIINKLISLLCEGGFGMIHFTFDNEQPVWKNLIYDFKRKYKWGRQLLNVLQGKAASTPHMQMNNYDLKKVFRIFRMHKIDTIAIQFTNHGGFLGAGVYFRK